MAAGEARASPRPSPRSRSRAGSASDSASAGRAPCCARSDRPRPGLRGALIGGTNGKGSVQAMVGCRARAGGAARRPDAQAAPGQLPRADRRRRPPLPPDDFADVAARCPVGQRRRGPPPRAADRVRGPHRGRVPGSPGRASRWPWSRSASAAGSTRPMPGTAAWPRSPTWRSTTWRPRRHPGRHRPREGGHHQARRPGRHGRRAATGWRSSGAARARVGVPLAEVDAADGRWAWTVRGLQLAPRWPGRAAPGPARPPPGGQRGGRARHPRRPRARRASPTLVAATIRDGLAAARWPGRLELLGLAADGRAGPARPERPRPDDARTCSSTAPTTRPAWPPSRTRSTSCGPSLSPGRATLLLGLLATRTWPAWSSRCASAGALRGARIITTQVDAPRALPAADLAAAWRCGRGAGADPRSWPARRSSGPRDGHPLGAPDGGPLLVRARCTSSVRSAAGWSRRSMRPEHGRSCSWPTVETG